MSALLTLAISVLLLNYWLCMPVRQADHIDSRTGPAVVFSGIALIVTAPLVWALAALLSTQQLLPLRSVAAVLVLSIAIQLCVRFMTARIEMSPMETEALRHRTLLNCSVFALTLLHSSLLTDLGTTLLLGFAVGVGAETALYVFTAQQAKLARSPVPEPFRGAPITLISAGLMALAVMGLQGLWQ
jgi:Na+-translocating ferredoxin:NAD+ oxidoreductase subunit A